MGILPRTKDDICRVLRLVKDDPMHNIRKTRWVNYTKPFKRRSFIIYAERWVQLVRQLNPTARLAQPTQRLLDTVRIMFNELQSPFETLRHTDACLRRTTKCHKSHSKCRHNFPDMSVTIRYLLIVLDDWGALGDEPALHIKHFRRLKTAKKRKDFADLFTQMCRLAGWNVNKSKIYASYRVCLIRSCDASSSDAASRLLRRVRVHA